MANKIEGGDLMLFYNSKSIAYATSHTLSINAETQSVNNKDDGAGGWSSEEINLLSWTVTSENLYSEDGEGIGYDELFQLMISKTPIDVVFALKAESSVNVPEGGWTPKANNGYSGKVILTSLELNAASGEKATFSVTMNGFGALSKVS